MKKLLSILGAFTFIAAPAATVIACGETETINLSSIQDVVKDGSSLGIFKAAPDADAVKSTLGARTINTNEIEVGTPANGQVKVSVKAGSEVYKEESITLTYGVGDRVDVTTVFKSTDLGEFETTPTEAQIHARLVANIAEIAPGLVAEDVQVDVTGGPTFSGVEGFRADFSVKDGSTNYNRSWVHMTYTVNSSQTPGTGTVKLGDVLKTTQLDSSQFDHHLAASEIIKMVKEANTDLTDEQANELQVKVNQAGGSAVLIVAPNATHLDPTSAEIGVTYQAIKNITAGGSGIWTRNLGQLPASPTVEDVLAAVKKVNANVVEAEISLIQTDIHVENNLGSAIITTKAPAEGEATYKGKFSVMVYFTTAVAE